MDPAEACELSSPEPEAVTVFDDPDCERARRFGACWAEARFAAAERNARPLPGEWPLAFEHAAEAARRLGCSDRPEVVRRLAMLVHVGARVRWRELMVRHGTNTQVNLPVDS
jgi:hypothetical protein